VFTSGCSSLRGTLITGSVLGGSLGAMSGVVFSPNKESRPGNALIFGTLGAGIGALIGHYFYTNDPENRDLKQMLYEKDLKEEVKIKRKTSVFLILHQSLKTSNQM